MSTPPVEAAAEKTMQLADDIRLLGRLNPCADIVA
jgi:hypothetical protein